MKSLFDHYSMKPFRVRDKNFSRTVVWVLILMVLPACGATSLLKEDPNDQRYLERTQEYFPNLNDGIQAARFGAVNRDALGDLVVLRSNRSGRPGVQVWINQSGKKFVLNKRPGWVGGKQDRVVFMAVRDLKR